MILTCPECATKYVVKDGAIPEGGRKVRCSSCKASWHQDPEGSSMPAEPDVAEPQEPTSSPFVDQPREVGAVVESEPVAIPGDAGLGTIDRGTIDPDFTPPGLMDSAPGEDPPVDDAGPIVGATPDWQPVDTGSAREATEATEEPIGPSVDATETDDFQPFAYPDDEDPAPPRRWPLVLGIILLIAGAVVAFWYFAPAAMKQRVGLAQASSPLEVMSTSYQRQELESGNDLLTVSGRIINPTGTTQRVPALRAELLDQSKSKVVHSWMISPPVDTLSPNESSTFHSAEMDVPEGGKFLRVRLSTEG